MSKIATRVSQLTGEGALAVFTRAKELEKEGKSIIHLELGEPDFHAAPPVVKAVQEAVASGGDRVRYDARILRCERRLRST